MWSGWQRLSREQKRIWSFIVAGVVCGSVLKSGVFAAARNVMVEDFKRVHLDGVERLQEAKEFSEWSKKDREKRLPKLTPEQREQLHEYLKIVQQHGIHQAYSDDADCSVSKCPVLKNTKNALVSMTGSSQ